MSGALVVFVILGNLVSQSVQQDVNSRMEQFCNETNMPNLFDTVDFDRFSGVWYATHVTTSFSNVLPDGVLGVRRDINGITATGIDGKEADFVTIQKTNLVNHGWLWGINCVNLTPIPMALNQNEADIASGYFYHKLEAVAASDSNDEVAAGGYLSWIEETILATDYNTTVVSLVQYVFNNVRDIRFSEIQIHVRDRTAAPSDAVVAAALDDSDFCSGNMLDLTSYFWVQIQNQNNNQACFNPSQ